MPGLGKGRLDRGGEVSESPGGPTGAGVQRLERSVCVLLRRHRVVHVCRPQRMKGAYLRVEIDSGFAGDLLARRSMTLSPCSLVPTC